MGLKNPGAEKPNVSYPGAFRSDLAYPREMVPPPVTMHLKGLNGNKDLGPAKTLMDPFWPENPSGLPRKARFHIEKGLGEMADTNIERNTWWHAPHAYYNPNPLKQVCFRADGGQSPYKCPLGHFDHARCSKLANRCSADNGYRKTMDSRWKTLIRGRGDVWKEHDETIRSLPPHARTAGRAVFKATRDWLKTNKDLTKSASAPTVSGPGCCTPAPNSKKLTHSSSAASGDVSLDHSGHGSKEDSVHGRTQRERLVKVLAKYAAEKTAASLERQLKHEERRRIVAEQLLRQS